MYQSCSKVKYTIFSETGYPEIYRRSIQRSDYYSGIDTRVPVLFWPSRHGDIVLKFAFVVNFHTTNKLPTFKTVA